MLKIKLSRFGKKNQPSFRVIIAEAKSKINGRYLDCLGFYNPLAKTHQFKIDKEKYQDWITKGAKPTKSVQSLVKKVV